jgi:serine/threonine-protein kinase
MTSEQYRRVRLLFDEALKRPESARLLFLQAECAEDTEVLRQVESLLCAHGDAQFFLQEDQSSQRQFGRYRITEVIGRGAMGIVYGANDPAIHRQIAIKVIQLHSLGSGKDAAFLRERLFREAHMAGLLSHPGIITIFDLGEYEGQTYIVMERIWGPSLQTVLDSGVRLTHAQSLDILRQIASALDYAHVHRVVHRDVKPANILLQDGKIVKVVDFGIAKIVTAQEQSRTGFGVGTPSYMSPEQIEVGSIDGRSDQFSLAVIAFEMLTGTRPFKGDSPASVLHSIVYGDRPSAHVESSKLPVRVDGVFLRALNRRREDRYASCNEFVRSLESALGDVPPTTSVNGTQKQRIGPMRYSIAVGLVVIALFFGFLFHKPLDSVWVLLWEQPLTQEQTATIRKQQDGNVQDPHLLYDKATAELNTGRSEQALALFREAATAGDANSMVELAEIYSAGVIVNRDDTEAIRWYRKAAETGDPRGMLQLGGMYSLGVGVAQDNQAAAHWFHAAADTGNPSAMFDLGWLYERGQGIPKDLKRANELYRQAAALGNNEARRRLALGIQQ